MITELRLGNFKAFGEMQRIPIKPLTLIFGANSSGKSSIIHGLLLANHALESGNFEIHSPRLAGGMVDLGGFRSYVHAHEQNRSISLHLESTTNAELLRDALLGTDDEEKAAFSRFSRFGLTLRWGASTMVDQIEVQLDGHAVLCFTQLEDGKFRCEPLPGCLEVLAHEVHRMMEALAWTKKAPCMYLDLEPPSLDDDPKTPEQRETAKREYEHALAEYNRQRQEHRDTFKPPSEHLSEFAMDFQSAAQERHFTVKDFVVQNHWPERLCGTPSLQGQVIEVCEGDGVSGRFEEFLSYHEPRLFLPAAHALRFNLTNLIRFCSTQTWEVVRRLCYLGPLRQVPSRYFSEIVNEQVIQPVGAPSWTRLASSPDLVEDVNRWLKDRLGTPYSVQICRLQDNTGAERALFPEFLDGQSKITLSHRDLGFGMSQVIPLLIEAAARENGLVAVEQPELHLHPAQQAELGDVFIESALGQRKNIFLLETHSEHLILRILRRIRETTAGTRPEGLPAIRPEEVAVLYVKPTEKGSVVIELPVTPDGDFSEPWPDGFFPERAKELF